MINIFTYSQSYFKNGCFEIKVLTMCCWYGKNKAKDED